MARPKVLIAEDEAITALSIRMALEKTGHEVCAAVATGEKAETSFASTGADLVVMDIGLGGEMDGIEAASRIRELAQVPLIFISGYDDEAMRRRAAALDPAGYLVKPLDLAVLVTAVDAALSASGAAAIPT